MSESPIDKLKLLRDEAKEIFDEDERRYANLQRENEGLRETIRKLIHNDHSECWRQRDQIQKENSELRRVNEMLQESIKHERDCWYCNEDGCEKCKLCPTKAALSASEKLREGGGV